MEKNNELCGLDGDGFVVMIPLNALKELSLKNSFFTDKCRAKKKIQCVKQIHRTKEVNFSILNSDDKVIKDHNINGNGDERKHGSYWYDDADYDDDDDDDDKLEKNNELCGLDGDGFVVMIPLNALKELSLKNRFLRISLVQKNFNA